MAYPQTWATRIIKVANKFVWHVYDPEADNQYEVVGYGETETYEQAEDAIFYKLKELGFVK